MASARHHGQEVGWTFQRCRYAPRENARALFAALDRRRMRADAHAMVLAGWPRAPSAAPSKQKAPDFRGLSQYRYRDSNTPEPCSAVSPSPKNPC